MPVIFQSTLPVGGATLITAPAAPEHDISIHAPRGGSDFFDGILSTGDDYFNPRSPWGERRTAKKANQPPALFQSTLPVGGATLRKLGGKTAV